MAVTAGSRVGLVPLEGLRFRSKLTVAAVEDAVAAQVAVLVLQARVVVPQTLLEVEQLLRLGVAEVVDAPELPRQDQDLAVGVDDLRVEIGVLDGRAERDGTVVRQDDR